MSRTTGRSVIHTGPVHEAIPDRMASTAAPVEPFVPAEVSAAASASVLRLPGVVLAPSRLLGRKVAVVAELIPDAHAERLAHGHTPMTDRTTVSTWVWPETRDRVPPVAVRVNGVLAVSRHWRTAMASVAPFTRFTSTAIVVPASAVGTHDYWVNCVFHARELGVNILAVEADGAVRLVWTGRSPEEPAPLTAAMRVAHELVYERLLAQPSGS